MTEEMTEDQMIFKIENEAGRFPPQMLLIPNLFAFSFAEYQDLLQTAFTCNAELVATLKKTADYVRDSDLDAEFSESVCRLLDDEAEVVSYSQSARCSVISL